MEKYIGGVETSDTEVGPCAREEDRFCGERLDFCGYGNGVSAVGAWVYDAR